MGGFLGIGTSPEAIAASDATGVMQQDAAQQSALMNDLMPIYNQLMQDYQTNYEPVEGPTGAGEASLATTASGSAPGALGAATDYLSDPSGTLSGTGGFGGFDLASLYKQAQQGLSPATWSAALNAVDTTGAQLMNSAENSFGAAVPNAAGMAGDIANKTLEAQASTAAQMAGQNQGFQDQAMQQLYTTSAGMDANTLQMLEQAYGLPAGALSNSAAYIQGGSGGLTTATGGLTGFANNYGSAAAAAGQSAANAKSQIPTFGSSLIGLAGAAAPFIKIK